MKEKFILLTNDFSLEITKEQTCKFFEEMEKITPLYDYVFEQDSLPNGDAFYHTFTFNKQRFYMIIHEVEVK